MKITAITLYLPDAEKVRHEVGYNDVDSILNNKGNGSCYLVMFKSGEIINYRDIPAILTLQ